MADERTTDLATAVEAVLAAYRARYGGLAMGGIRRNAPLQKEMGDLAIALLETRRVQP